MVEPSLSRLCASAVLLVALLATNCLIALQLQLLEWCDVRESRHQPHPGLLEARTDTGERAQLVDRREHRALVDQALDLMEHRFALRAIELLRLALEEIVDLGDDAV